MQDKHDTISITLTREDAEVIVTRRNDWIKLYQKVMYNLRDMINEELDA